MKLADRYGRVQTRLRLSVTDRCAFRCLYCIQEGELGPKELLLSFEEIEKAVRAFTLLGIEQVRLTGGEPLQRRQVELLAKRLRELAGIKRLSLTTNGYHLAEKALLLKEAGVDDVNISLDTLRPDRFQAICGQDALERVLCGIRAAREAGLHPKINTVVMGGVNDDEILSLLSFAQAEGLLLRFIEWMPVAGVPWEREKVVPAAEILRRASAQGEITPLPAKHQPASLYCIEPAGTIFGIIPTISRPFCEDCNRLRLSARGELFTCLFARRGFPLRPYLDDPDLPLLLRQLVYRKEEGFAASPSQVSVPMVMMGG